jgi:hypothetical protein
VGFGNVELGGERFLGGIGLLEEISERSVFLRHERILVRVLRTCQRLFSHFANPLILLAVNGLRTDNDLAVSKRALKTSTVKNKKPQHPLDSLDASILQCLKEEGLDNADLTSMGLADSSVSDILNGKRGFPKRHYPGLLEAVGSEAFLNAFARASDLSRHKIEGQHQANGSRPSSYAPNLRLSLPSSEVQHARIGSPSSRAFESLVAKEAVAATDAITDFSKDLNKWQEGIAEWKRRLSKVLTLAGERVSAQRIGEQDSMARDRTPRNPPRHRNRNR